MASGWRHVLIVLITRSFSAVAQSNPGVCQRESAVVVFPAVSWIEGLRLGRRVWDWTGWR